MPSTPASRIGGDADKRALLVDLISRFRSSPTSTTAERAAKDQLLDDLQDAVGLSGQMTTERDILRRADLMLQQA